MYKYIQTKNDSVIKKSRKKKEERRNTEKEGKKKTHKACTVTNDRTSVQLGFGVTYSYINSAVLLKRYTSMILVIVY